MAHRPPRATKQKALEGSHLMEEDSSNEDNLGPQRAFARHMAESVSSVPEVEEKVKEEPAEEQGEEVQEVAQGDEGQGEEEEGNTTPH
ncbi:unnamed protein product [Gadus morhua 'NCC']